jgi:hypothetical protein
MKLKQTFCITYVLLTLLLTTNFSVVGQTLKQQKLELTRLQLENKFSSVGEFDTTSLIATYSINGKYGYIDTTGRELKIKTSEKIYSYFSFINGYALIGTIVDNNKRLYIIDKKGTVLQKLNNIDDVREWKNIDRIIAKDISGRHGVINRKGKIVIPFKYYLLESIDDKYLRAYVGESFNFKVGVIDFKDSVIVPATNDQLYYFNKLADYLLICNGKDLIAIDKGKKYIAKNAFPKYYPEPSRLYVDFNNGLILNKTHDTDILYDLKLDTIKAITQRFDDIDFISNGFIGVRNWLNKEFDSTARFTKGSGSEFSLLTKEGKIIKPMFLGDASEFIEGMSRTIEVKNNYGYTGFMNKNCVIAIPCIYKRATDFKNGFAKVQKDDKYFLIDKEGNFVMDIKPF